ncbi:hypothetical protein GGR50DRAFT_698941 [Xylaria sp. CBS 124048]|nr:hypothetical protein GGR50DRAFT_698941 [Xylaria sp. CBS 124048]
MSNSDGFPAFQIEFTHWASQAGINLGELKNDLHGKLPRRLNELMAEKNIDDTVTYKNHTGATSTRCSLPAASSSDPTRNPGSSTGGSHYDIRVCGTASNGHAIHQKLTLERNRQLVKNGKCFICHEKGHSKTNCPLHTDWEALHDNCINAIVAEFAGSSNY